MISLISIISSVIILFIGLFFYEKTKEKGKIPFHERLKKR
jgi:hypothetical protein